MTKLRLIIPQRRVCLDCEEGRHSLCEPIPVIERGLVEGTVYTDCLCLCDYGFPAWGARKHDSEKRP
jgi:hypothetical protein